MACLDRTQYVGFCALTAFLCSFINLTSRLNYLDTSWLSLSKIAQPEHTNGGPIVQRVRRGLPCGKVLVGHSVQSGLNDPKKPKRDSRKRNRGALRSIQKHS